MTPAELARIANYVEGDNPFANQDDMRALVAEVKRLRALIEEHETCNEAQQICCPWCGRGDVLTFPGHRADCPAFSAPGVVR